MITHGHVHVFGQAETLGMFWFGSLMDHFLRFGSKLAFTVVAENDDSESSILFNFAYKH